MKIWLMAIIALVVAMIGFVGTTHDASAAIFYPDRIVLAESGDSVWRICEQAKDVDLVASAKKCRTAMIKKYGTKIKAGVAYKMPPLSNSKVSKEATVASSVTSVETSDNTPTNSVVSPEQTEPVEIADTTSTSPEPTPQETFETPIPAVYAPLVAPPVDDEGFRNNPVPQVVACANGITGNVIWSLESIPSDLRNAVYQTGRKVMTSLALKVCGGERLQMADTMSPHNSA